MEKIEPSNLQNQTLPPTEARLGSTKQFDALSPLEMVRCMNKEDACLAAVVAAEEKAIAEVVTRAADAFSAGGRLIYVGAGTSGRLGVLDAAECPPTFGVPLGQVIGLIAGGESAMRKSVEGAEDDGDAAARDLAVLEPPVDSNDLVLGISASGTTPYVLAALAEAEKRGAAAVLLCCNPSQRDAAPMVVALKTGPEVLAGSTRLKAGTAVKMVLNMISTGAMALSGRVFEGLMVGMRPVNQKLQARAIRIVEQLTGKSETAAKELLEDANGRIPVAVLMARKSLSAKEALKRLADTGGSLRTALEEGKGS